MDLPISLAITTAFATNVVGTWLGRTHLFVDSAAWIVFFALLGLLNLYVAYSFSTSDWATFKVFGATGLLLAFTVAQGFYISRHLPPEGTEPPTSAP